MKLKEKITNMSPDKKQKIIGMIVIFVGFVIVGFFVRTVFDGEESKDIKETVKETETISYDLEDISEEDAANKMQLEIEIPGEIEKRIPSIETFKKEFENYLIEEDFWEDTTRAKSDYVITEDFNSNTIELGFSLNDRAMTNITVTIDKNDGSYTFNYF